MTRTINIAVVPGDGIGPEVCDSATEVLVTALAGTGIEARLSSFAGGAREFERSGDALPPATLEGCRTADAVLHGAAGLPDVNLPDGTEAGQDFSMKMRSSLDLFANIRPVRNYAGIAPTLAGKGEAAIDYVIVRENTEGLYAARSGGNVIRDEVATDTMVFTRKGVERICHKAAQVAIQRNGKKRVTIVDKANVLRGYAYFRKIALSVFAEYPELEVDCILVDAMTFHMVRNPERFDVIVTENIFGDILSDLAAATVGGLGIAPSAEVGTTHGYFQGIHGSAPELAGKDLANPIATILSAGEMALWLAGKLDLPQLAQVARRIDLAVAAVIAEKRHVTRDIGGPAGTKACTAAIIAKLQESTVPA